MVRQEQIVLPSWPLSLQSRQTHLPQQLLKLDVVAVEKDSTIGVLYWLHALPPGDQLPPVPPGGPEEKDGQRSL